MTNSNPPIRQSAIRAILGAIGARWRTDLLSPPDIPAGLRQLRFAAQVGSAQRGRGPRTAGPC
eukprot:8456755-Alexandrium_andersonii.AAC.1